MEFLEPLASLLGVTAGQLTTVVIVGMLLVAGWYMLRAALRIAVRVFTMGCITILVVVAGLYLLFAVAR
jgi:hypothetical protein